MFCYQCEQTNSNKFCQNIGVCGKNETTAEIQDKIVSALIDIANGAERNEKNTNLIINGLFMTITNVNFDDIFLQKALDIIKNAYYAENPFDIQTLWNENDDTKSLKSIILFGIKGMAAFAYHARRFNYKSEVVDSFFFEALQAISKNLSLNELGALVMKTGEVNLKALELLDRANTETYGHPKPTLVSTDIEAGPFIVVSGHDLRDLALLLEQTQNTGINIYTHGEMLPCHAYPELKKYPHLKGNFGTAWQNQQKEFENIPAPILFTTNCMMPVQESYADRTFTTSVVSYPKVRHIDKNKDFTPIINKSLELGGYKTLQHRTGLNGGSVLAVGYGHNTIISLVDKIVDLLNRGKIKHIFIVGGCDGAKIGRNYYTEFVKKIPNNSLILTYACGKYRFNDIFTDKIEDIPHIMDMGQCNDTYSAIKVVRELAKKLNCNINNLPVSFVISWYEQKSVSILLTLLYLGIQNIRLGPGMPAFVSPNIMRMLINKFKIKPISTPDDDLKAILG
ncbi:hydroxylamine reductase [bacterium]|nr:hydroxylamine reductase [bacterium]